MKKNFYCVVLIVLLILTFAACESNASEEYEYESVGEGISEDQTDVEVNADFSEDLNKNRDYQIIINSKNPYDFKGEYATELKDDIVYTKDYDKVPRPLEKATYSAFSAFKKKMSEDYNIDVALVSGYRDETEQRMVNEGYYTNLPVGKIEFEDSTTPGCSEFHTGLLLLFAIKDDGVWKTDEELRNDTTYDSVWEELENYGFVIRYPEGKELITEMPYNPYIIRFIGDSGLAHELVKNNECMEEYFKNSIK